VKADETAAGVGRFAEIDHLKAIGILAVILIHSVRDPWDPRLSSLDVWIGNVTRFAVPSFLLCSGFLYATRSRIPSKTVLRRLRRVLVPYLVASAGAQLWWLWHGEGRDLSTLVGEVLLGASFGPYYYVFVHFWLVLFAPLFAVLPRSALWGLTAAMLLSQGLLETRTIRLFTFFWHIRDPLLWWGYFLLGWVLRLHHEPVRRFVTSHRGALVAAAVAAVGLLALLMNGYPGSAWVGAFQWLCIYAIIALVFVATCGRGKPWRAVAVLADATFAIYLFHIFFLYASEEIVGPASSRFGLAEIGINWCAGLLGALGVIAVVRAALGARSRDVIGA